MKYFNGKFRNSTSEKKMSVPKHQKILMLNVMHAQKTFLKTPSFVFDVQFRNYFSGSKT
jgi:hypothetical protein